MEANRVYSIIYDATERGGDPDDAGIIEGFWTGAIDYVGKRTIRRTDGGPTIYLFEDEIIEAADPD